MAERQPEPEKPLKASGDLPDYRVDEPPSPTPTVNPLIDGRMMLLAEQQESPRPGPGPSFQISSPAASEVKLYMSSDVQWLSGNNRKHEAVFKFINAVVPFMTQNLAGPVGELLTAYYHMREGLAHNFEVGRSAQANMDTLLINVGDREEFTKCFNVIVDGMDAIRDLNEESQVIREKMAAVTKELMKLTAHKRREEATKKEEDAILEIYQKVGESELELNQEKAKKEIVEARKRSQAEFLGRIDKRLYQIQQHMQYNTDKIRELAGRDYETTRWTTGGQLLFWKKVDTSFYRKQYSDRNAELKKQSREMEDWKKSAQTDLCDFAINHADKVESVGKRMKALEDQITSKQGKLAILNESCIQDVANLCVTGDVDPKDLAMNITGLLEMIEPLDIMRHYFNVAKRDITLKRDNKLNPTSAIVGMQYILKAPVYHACFSGSDATPLMISENFGRQFSLVMDATKMIALPNTKAGKYDVTLKAEEIMDPKKTDFNAWAE